MRVNRRLFELRTHYLSKKPAASIIGRFSQKVESSFGSAELVEETVDHIIDRLVAEDDEISVDGAKRRVSVLTPFSIFFLDGVDVGTADLIFFASVSGPHPFETDFGRRIDVADDIGRIHPRQDRREFVVQTLHDRSIEPRDTRRGECEEDTLGRSDASFEQNDFGSTGQFVGDNGRSKHRGDDGQL